jgi:hypothetical protein
MAAPFFVGRRSAAPMRCDPPARVGRPPLRGGFVYMEKESI